MEEALKMENKLLEEREECYEEEISLYDILDILKKYKKDITDYRYRNFIKFWTGSHSQTIPKRSSCA